MDPTPATLARAILLVAALAGGIAAVAAYAAPHDAPFSLAAPRAGDRWAYNVTALDGPVTLPSKATWVASTFERGLPHLAVDAAGTWHLAQDITERQEMQGAAGKVLRHEVAGPVTVAATQETHRGGSSRTTVVTPNDLNFTGSEVETQWTWRTSYGAEAPCGHAIALQGDAATVAGDCGGTTFHKLGRTSGGLLVLGNGPTKLWLSPSVPVPVRVEQPLPSNRTRTLALALVGFTPGGLAEPATPALPAPLPPLATAPGDRPRDDLPLAFPLDAALRRAHASGPLADFERAHPGAYLRRAAFSDYANDIAPGRNRVLRWDLEATDGREAAAVRVTWTWKSPSADDRVESLWRSAQAPMEDVSGLKANAGPYPPAAPTAWPTVASALARWHALGGVRENAWGFEAACAGPRCSAAEARTLVGHDDTYVTEQPVAVSPVIIDRRTADLAAFSADGTAWREAARFQGIKETSFGPLVLDDAAPAHDAPLAAAAVPALPLGLAAAAGLAMLAALLPAKLLAALWHRQAKGHPLRTQIEQLLEAEPGLHHTEILRRLGRGNSVVSHHLRTLERAGRVVARQGPRYKVYFLATQPVPAHAALAKSPLATCILAELEEPATGRQLADRLGVAPSSVAFHVRRFQDAGLVVAHRVGREVVLRRAPAQS
jgi:DNA-binding transcriptional ArsR family regulator